MTDVVELLGQLIKINSVNGSMADGPGEAEIAQFVADLGRRAGAEVTLDEALPGRPNVSLSLPATARGAGDARPRRLLFDVHLDTVPTDQMPEPFTPRVDVGRMWGRGACDTKASLAAALVALERVATEERRAEIVLLCSVDEEYRKRGVIHAVRRGLTADAAVVGEPTNLRPIVAHKGALRWRTTVVGKAAHTSRPENGVNAIYGMVELIEALRERLEPGLSLQRHPLLTPPTLTVGMIQGGVGVNVVPERCWIDVDRRTLPQEDPQTILAEVDGIGAAIQARNPGLRIERDEPYLSERGLETAPDSQVVLALQEACRRVLGPAADVTPSGVPYGTDGTALWAMASIPTVVFGPGDIAQAHSADEWVELEQVRQAAEIDYRLMTSYARGAG